MSVKFDWGKTPQPSSFVKDKRFNGVNQRKSEVSTERLERNPGSAYIDLSVRQVTPYQVAGSLKKKPKLKE